MRGVRRLRYLSPRPWSPNHSPLGTAAQDRAALPGVSTSGSLRPQTRHTPRDSPVRVDSGFEPRPNSTRMFRTRHACGGSRGRVDSGLVDARLGGACGVWGSGLARGTPGPGLRESTLRTGWRAGLSPEPFHDPEREPGERGWCSGSCLRAKSDPQRQPGQTRLALRVVGGFGTWLRAPPGPAPPGPAPPGPAPPGPAPPGPAPPGPAGPGGPAGVRDGGPGPAAGCAGGRGRQVARGHGWWLVRLSEPVARIK
ncbi:hypothetical protein FB565_004143 [Actinoplanes lutulentus]|uniref:Uncharacterized protein n=1 Tax=Actinoplanes lutulentus TaxID=1287878 RepID=A0A327ZMR0_9ACTN|nr:hypothetical protein [Actinoplanes lutulentus]RAK42354.1 hypothetical protein B0I29_102179 [Actinoplanes lutulentus]